ncbi:MAG: DsbA family protein [Coriobacteriia bacterium]|nr:DsbA family protein [Coriobacteriia bacterium]
MDDFLNFGNDKPLTYYEDLESEIEIFEFTDPICVWSWGSEPLIRALEFRYPGILDTDFITAGLIKDVREFFDYGTGVGEDPYASNRAMVKNWIKSKDRHQMPVVDQEVQIFDDKHASSFPANIAYKAAQFQSRSAAKRFLRLMREAYFVRGLAPNHTDVLVKLAEEAGLDIGMFLEDFKSREAKKAFLDDQEAAGNYSVLGFPAFLIRIGNKETLLKGFHPIENLITAIDELSEGKYKAQTPELNDENIMQYFERFISAFPVELALAFDLADLDELQKRLDELVERGLLLAQEADDTKLYTYVDQDPLHMEVWNQL